MLHTKSCQYVFTFQHNVPSGMLTKSQQSLSSTSSKVVSTPQYLLSFTSIIIIVHWHPFLPPFEILFHTVAMINQLNRGDGQPTPYFFRGPTGGNPAGVNHYVSQHLMLDFHYPCSPVCRGLPVAPWFNPAAAVAPMIELDLARQLMQDVSTLAEVPSQSWRNLPASRVCCRTSSTVEPSWEDPVEAFLRA